MVQASEYARVRMQLVRVENRDSSTSMVSILILSAMRSLRCCGHLGEQTLPRRIPVPEVVEAVPILGM